METVDRDRVEGDHEAKRGQRGHEGKEGEEREGRCGVIPVVPVRAEQGYHADGREESDSCRCIHRMESEERGVSSKIPHKMNANLDKFQVKLQ